jgi:hypothetical protein
MTPDDAFWLAVWQRSRVTRYEYEGATAALLAAVKLASDPTKETFYPYMGKTADYAASKAQLTMRLVRRMGLLDKLEAARRAA